ncbi:MAG: MFS transporter, partial [Planctomycetota bacterium]|nr:MFS transporter [Planctomycetota bacterium]
MDHSSRNKLMWASFLTLVASGMGFAVRTAMGGIWGAQFNIDGQQFGSIMGAGFLGFGIMIFFGGILTEKFGYKRLLMLAFVLHLISAIMLFFPRFQPNNAFLLLYYSVFLFSIAQGLYEAVINPLIADLYPDNKTHYLNILHAGWPGGMIVGGLLAATFVGDEAWITNVAYWEIPLASFVVLLFMYAILAFPQQFPETVGEKTAGNWGLLFSCFASPI